VSQYDYHVHSNYSDGDFLWRMVAAAADAGLDAVGFADHCTAATDSDRRAEAARNGFALDVTYERRREGIESIRARESTDVAIYDAVEMDYHPGDEAAIAEFLAAAEFDYAIGSVHHLDGTNVHVQSHFEEKSEAERRALVDEYVDRLVALVDSELFEIAAHLDLVERTPALRGFADEDHYHRVAEAFADSRTVPELNAGRVLEAYGEFHPSPPFLGLLRDHDVPFVVGSDTHHAGNLAEVHGAIDDRLSALDVEPVSLDVG